MNIYSCLGLFELQVTASDADGNSSPVAAEVFIHIVDAAAPDAAQPPLFQQRIYRFTAPEDAGLHSALGSVGLRTTAGESPARLFLYPEEIRRYFDINPETGMLQTAAPLDHEKAAEFLVNVGATAAGKGAVTGTSGCHHVQAPPHTCERMLAGDDSGHDGGGGEGFEILPARE